MGSGGSNLKDGNLIKAVYKLPPGIDLLVEPESFQFTLQYVISLRKLCFTCNFRSLSWGSSSEENKRYVTYDTNKSEIKTKSKYDDLYVKETGDEISIYDHVADMPSINSNSKILSKSIIKGSTTIVQKPAMKKALITLVNFMEENGFDCDSKLQWAISDEEFKSRYESWSYFKNYDDIERYPDVNEVVNDLLQIFPFYESSIKGFLKEYK